MSKTRTEGSVPTAKAKSFVFNNIPAREYTIIAIYGKKTFRKNGLLLAKLTKLKRKAVLERRE